MQSQNFVTGFLSLMFEPNSTSIVLQSFSNCLLEMSALPTSIADFVILVFKSCSEHYEQFAQLGNDWSLAIVRGLVHMVSLLPYFDKVADPALAFLQNQPTAEMFHEICTIMMLVIQTQQHELLDRRPAMVAVERDVPAVPERDERVDQPGDGSDIVGSNPRDHAAGAARVCALAVSR
jgi:hypothetical protein